DRQVDDDAVAGVLAAVAVARGGVVVAGRHLDAGGGQQGEDQERDERGEGARTGHRVTSFQRPWRAPMTPGPSSGLGSPAAARHPASTRAARSPSSSGVASPPSVTRTASTGTAG